MSDLTKLGREDLDLVASALGVEKPADLPNKEAVAEAILATKAPAAPPEPELDRLPLERRQSTGEWKCPFCDSPGGSNESRELRCQTPYCGARVEGDEVVRALR
jgi:hypothetical protein